MKPIIWGDLIEKVDTSPESMKSGIKWLTKNMPRKKKKKKKKKKKLQKMFTEMWVHAAAHR